MQIKPLFPVTVFGELALIKYYPEPGIWLAYDPLRRAGPILVPSLLI